MDTFHFEGPEKELTIDFIQLEKSNLRCIPRKDLDKILLAGKCEILTKKSNATFDSYVLSESSLFVFEKRIIIKTCGTTTLLFCLAPLIEIAKTLHMVFDKLTYCRKSYLYPKEQIFPHSSFAEELAFLKSNFSGNGVEMGPKGGDQWFIFSSTSESYINNGTTSTATTASNTPYNSSFEQTQKESDTDSDGTETDIFDESIPEETTFDIMMHDVCEETCKIFWKSEEHPDAESIEFACGMKDLMCGAEIDGFLFEPCGYSANGLLDNSYFTIHITPESSCSYVSFETNWKGYNLAHLKNLLALFKPKRFTVAQWGSINSDSVALIEEEVEECNMKTGGLCLENDVEFQMTCSEQTQVESNVSCRMSNWKKCG